MRHRWSEPVRPDSQNTLRTCINCGIVKITRHEPDNWPPQWTVWDSGGVKTVTEKTPPCEATEST